MSDRWIGKSVPRVEDGRLLTGRGTFIDDHPPVANACHAAIVRSPHPHARILGYDLQAALAMEGVVGVITGADVAQACKPFGVGVTTPVHYYPAAIDKVRFVGEPVAVVVARDRYLAEDAAEVVGVDYEPLPAVVDPEKALEPDAPILHDRVGSNLAGHRRLVYGDPDQAFADADVVVRERFKFPKYGSTPIETYGVIARWEPIDGVLTIWSNFMGPFIMHPLVARVLQLPENRLRFIVPPDIGGSFGIKSSIYPYLALMGLAAMKLGVPVKWIEDRREHLLASSSGTDRVAWREVAARKDGTILGMRFKWYDNVGGYIRSPEPGCSFRPTGNFVGPYNFQNLEVDASVVMTNKSLTGPNRGYACGHLYFETERMMDLLAARLGIDPVEIRRRNLIGADSFPYRTPTGGLYDSGDYQATFDKALDVAKYDELKREQAQARAAGRYFGIGLALAVDPSVSNMGYVATALDPQFRAKPEYLAKSGAVDAATIKIDPLGRVIAILGTTPQGQGHQTIVSQIVADELGLAPRDVTVVDEMDTFTRVWSISSGTYSSRFGSVGTSAVALAARKLKTKLVAYAAHLMDLPADAVEFRDGGVHRKARHGRRLLDQGSGRARPLEHRVAAGGHGAGAAGHRGVRLHGGQGRGRRRPGELVEHLRVHRRGDGGGGRSRHRRHHDREVRHRPRRRHHHQPDDRRGADLRRRPARAGRRALRGAGLRRRRPAPDRHLHGLPGADGDRGPRDRDRPRGVALAADDARLQGARRVLVDDRPRRHRQRRQRRPRAARHQHHRAADDPDPPARANQGRERRT